jgi:hypothetical protein
MRVTDKMFRLRKHRVCQLATFEACGLQSYWTHSKLCYFFPWPHVSARDFSGEIWLACKNILAQCLWGKWLWIVVVISMYQSAHRFSRYREFNGSGYQTTSYNFYKDRIGTIVCPTYKFPNNVTATESLAQFYSIIYLDLYRVINSEEVLNWRLEITQ